MSGFDLGGAVNSFADWICRAPLIGTVVSNPFLAALLITALTVVIILAMYREQIRSGGLKKKVRAFLYIFLVVVAVCFFHYYATKSLLRSEMSHDGMREVFAGISHSQTVGGAAGNFMNQGMYGEEASSAAEGGDDSLAVHSTASPNFGLRDCGCDGPPAIGGSRTTLPRRDNIKLDDDLFLEDVVVTARPMAATRR